jgi:hypothetical protein
MTSLIGASARGLPMDCPVAAPAAGPSGPHRSVARGRGPLGGRVVRIGLAAAGLFSLMPVFGLLLASIGGDVDVLASGAFLSMVVPLARSGAVGAHDQIGRLARDPFPVVRRERLGAVQCRHPPLGDGQE